MKDSPRIVVGITSLNCLGTTGPEGSMLWSRKGFGSISKGEPSVGSAKPKVLESRFRSTARVPVLLYLLCKSCFMLSNNDTKLACCAVEVY